MNKSFLNFLNYNYFSLSLYKEKESVKKKKIFLSPFSFGLKLK